MSPHRARGGWDLMQMSPSSPRDSLEPRGIVPCLQLGLNGHRMGPACRSGQEVKKELAGFCPPAEGENSSRRAGAGRRVQLSWGRQWRRRWAGSLPALEGLGGGEGCFHWV